MVDARASLKDHDEDSFPTLWESSFARPPWDAQVAGIAYDSAFEHFLLSLLWLTADLADHRVPASSEILLYEVSRATPGPGWDPTLSNAALWLRGVSFCSTGYHYAAEEELTKYLAGVQSLTPSPLLTQLFKLEGPHSHEALAAGYLVRAWNRHALGRKAPSEDDLERGLLELEAAGIDNEATQWGWVVLQSRRGKFKEAGEGLQTLANNPALDPKLREELRASALEMKSKEHALPVLLETRVTLIALGAVLTRLGGIDGIAKVLLTPEDFAALHAQLEAMRTLRGKMEKLGAPTLGDAEKGVVEAGKHGLDQLRGRLGLDRDGG